MNKKYYPLKETNIEKGAIDVFKQKIEKKKQEYLRFSLSKNYHNKKEENVKIEENNNSDRKFIYIETFDTYDKYILNIHDEESNSCKEDINEEEKDDITYKKSESKLKSKNEENIYIPLKILSNRYNYDDLVEATNNFSDENKIAKGGNGTVYKGILKGCINVAIKVLKKNENNGFENEIIIMSRYRHKNILSLLGYAMNKNNFYLIYEYANLGDLRTLLFNHYYFYNSKNKENLETSYSNAIFDDKFTPKNQYSSHSNNCFLSYKLNNFLSPSSFKNFGFQSNTFENHNPMFLSFSVRVNILVQIINVLCYLHTSSPIVYHRDLKSANILIDEKFNAKLGDFGLSFVYVNNNNIFNLTGGTPGYADPYYISTHEINEQTEIYSFGALILEMLVSKSPAIHVGKNYNCIYNKNEKCPIYCNKQKSETDENVFDYLVNHINMNDYKSIYSVLDYSVNFPDFLVEKLTKLSFLCLNPNIKSRPSSKLVNLILLEIQKESDFFIKKQKEILKRKINNINMYYDEYEKDKYNNNVSNNCRNNKEEQKYALDEKYNNSENSDLKNEKIKNNEYYKKIKNYNIYINHIKEINFNTLNQFFYKYIYLFFRNDKFCNLHKIGYKNLFSEFTQKNKDRKVDNIHLNKTITCNYINFKYNTISNMHNIKGFLFEKSHKHPFNKNFFLNPFSFNLMNCYFFRFIYDYLKNNNYHDPKNVSLIKDHSKYCRLKSYSNLFYSDEINYYKQINCELKKKYSNEGENSSNNKKDIKKDHNIRLDNIDNINKYNNFLNRENNIEKDIFIQEHRSSFMDKSIDNDVYYDHMNNKNNMCDRYYNSTSINNSDLLKNNINMCNNDHNNNAILMNKLYVSNKYNNLDYINNYRSNTYNEYIDSIQFNSQNHTDYENVNNYKDINDNEKNKNLDDLSNKSMNEEERKNSIYSSCVPFNDSYNLHHSNNEKKLHNNFCSNKWPLKRNCRDNTPQMIFNIKKENNMELKETNINNKKKIMRINISIDEEKIANSCEKYKCDLKKESINSKNSNDKVYKSPLKNYNPFKKENNNTFVEKNTFIPIRDIKENNIIYISNFINFINFDKSKNVNNSNVFSWFNKNIFEMIIDENRVVSDITFLDILYEFNILNFKKNNAKNCQSENKYFLKGEWNDYDKVENTFTSVNAQSNFFFEIAVYHDDKKNIHNIFLLKSNQLKDFICNQNKGTTKKIWISDYVGRRNEFVEKILKKTISNILYECISRKHCLFLLEVQMKTLNKPSCYDHKIKGDFLYYYFEYNVKVLCNSENCIFSNNYVLYKNNTYSYSLPNNILSLLVFSEDKIIKEICQNKNSSTATQRIHFPLYPFFVNINFYNEK
ncbi:tyrosine kinase-like protein, putative [Plasmodium gallinaceum]|uniref:Tyrosine kinase-like protein, putative n=1 Tax=Plasmodium gallinaceum TaxID=5849 RepID=A0A1J1GUV3_PLAGA|nr:tyrosine kinase-like protein, putative [Plasmodium gallinaceum]CRG96261.1 tyrosine kinase-like protein, putative [Plasmodium gallinaceum]